MAQAAPRTWVERVRLTNFRNYASLALDAGPEPVVLTGPNGSGKTNLLEAVSLLTAGRGCAARLPRVDAPGAPVAVAAAVQTLQGAVTSAPASSATACGRAGWCASTARTDRPGAFPARSRCSG